MQIAIIFLVLQVCVRAILDEVEAGSVAIIGIPVDKTVKREERTVKLKRTPGLTLHIRSKGNVLS
jgi:hypothetical protein